MKMSSSGRGFHHFTGQRSLGRDLLGQHPGRVQGPPGSHASPCMQVKRPPALSFTALTLPVNNSSLARVCKRFAKGSDIRVGRPHNRRGRENQVGRGSAAARPHDSQIADTLQRLERLRANANGPSDVQRVRRRIHLFQGLWPPVNTLTLESDSKSKYLSASR